MEIVKVTLELESNILRSLRIQHRHCSQANQKSGNCRDSDTLEAPKTKAERAKRCFSRILFKTDLMETQSEFPT